MASYLKAINFNKKVYLYGFKGIAQELTDAGIDFIGLGVSIYLDSILCFHDCRTHYSEKLLKQTTIVLNQFFATFLHLY